MAAMIRTPIRAKNPIPNTLSRSRNPCASNLGNPATIPAKIINEIPLPIPRSVIISPSQTKNMVPAAMENKAATVGRSASPENPTSAITLLCSKRTNCPYPWAKAIGIVIQWVRRLILARPASPSRDIS